MMRTIMENCGVFFVPQLLLSVLVVTLIAGYLLAVVRGEITPGARPWRRTLDPLAALAVSIGLLGSVVGFVSAFGSFQERGVNIPFLTQGLATAYYTTAVGLVTSLVAASGSYLLGILDAGKEES